MREIQQRRNPVFHGDIDLLQIVDVGKYRFEVGLDGRQHEDDDDGERPAHQLAESQGDGEGADDDQLVALGRQRTVDRMLPHVTHIGVHDHGFNNLSTYGNLLRLMHEGALPFNAWERRCYAQAVAVSGAVQAARWSETACGLGYIYSFNGPHSLFIDTMRTLRILSVSHQLGHVLMGENDVRVDLLRRTVEHALATSKYIVFHGDSEHTYDVRGRTAHEGTFNRNDGRFRSRATQQGYSPFSTWTRGLAWAMLGFAEQLEWLMGVEADAFKASVGREKSHVVAEYLRAARHTCDHYVDDVTATQEPVHDDKDAEPSGGAKSSKNCNGGIFGTVAQVIYFGIVHC